MSKVNQEEGRMTVHEYLKSELSKASTNLKSAQLLMNMDTFKTGEKRFKANTLRIQYLEAHIDALHYEIKHVDTIIE